MSLFTVSFYKVMVYDQFNFESYQKVLFIDILNVLVCFIYFVSLIYFLIVIVNERYTCMIALGCLLSIALSVIPLLFVSPIGNRNFYYIYVLWLIILLCIIKQYKVTTSYVQFILRILACTVGTITILWFSLIYFNSVQRIVEIEQQLAHGKRHNNIVLEKLSFENYTPFSTPMTSQHFNDFKNYYHLPKDLKIKIMPYGSNE